ncbi:sensor histidine kinase [Lacticaseibacillus zhaodongensis]|uniref:sensor histidine kinase n=1 Tax=Lacticaseibacillus zhaodongensis TaxID=2668065 RepID=UPI0012D2E834|nr:HAMP domain-containing sensor histidine kinase [Lacticaseibacillus zhaodongensis]
MRDFAAYLRARALTWVVLAVVLLVAGTITYLEDLPPIALLDGCVIGAACIIPILGVDAWRWCGHYRELRMAPEAEELPRLPDSGDAIEALYQQLLAAQNHARVQTQVQAQEQARNLSDNFALWSHQMKTPLAALDLLLQVPPVDAAAARGEVRKVNRYVQMMLTYIKMNDVNRDLVLEPTPLTPLVQHTVRELADLFIGKNLAVRVDPLPTIVTDSQWFGFIMEQVLTNAAKYTEHGHVHVYAKGPALVVADTGIGIAATDLPRLFEPGYSGYNGRMNQKASGLGLAMSQTIAQKLGLKLSVESKVGVGTKVYIHLAQTEWRTE